MRRTLSLLAALAVLAGAVLACNIPGVPEPSEPPATAPPVETEPPVETVPPVETAPPPETSAPPPVEPLVVTHQEGFFSIFALDGTLIETRPAPGLSWTRPGVVQVLGQDIYYVQDVDTGSLAGGNVVTRLTAAGSEQLDFTLTEGPHTLTFAVSPDGSRIQWGAGNWDINGNDSRLYLAGIDGSAQQVIAQASPNDAIDDYYVLEAVGWTSGADAIYSWQVSGIGGYILFFGYSSLYRYSPSTGTTTALVEVAGIGEPVSVCWGTLSPDEAYVAGWCGGDPFVQGVRERELATGVETVFPLWPSDQGQQGAAAYSPSGARLAYAIARSDMEDEFGQVILVDHLGSDLTMVASHGPGFFDTLVWADENRLVLGYWTADLAQTDLLDLDGLVRTSVGAGHLVGLMWP